jgi:hypothetical protein
MIVSYNTSAVKIYDHTNSLVRFGNKYFLLFKKCSAYYNAGIVVVVKS